MQQLIVTTRKRLGPLYLYKNCINYLLLLNEVCSYMFNQRTNLKIYWPTLVISITSNIVLEIEVMEKEYSFFDSCVLFILFFGVKSILGIIYIVIIWWLSNLDSYSIKRKFSPEPKNYSSLSYFHVKVFNVRHNKSWVVWDMEDLHSPWLQHII